MNSDPRYGARVRLLAVHTTEGAMTVAALKNFFDNPNAGGSSHASADESGALWGPAQGFVPYDRSAWTLLNGNPVSENIELCAWARYTRDEWLARPRLLDACARWLAERAVARGIPLVKLTPAQVRAGQAGVIGHIDWTLAVEGSHTDPGPNFPWDVVMAKAQAYAGGAPQPPLPAPRPVDASTFGLPAGHYWGDVEGPDESHGGIDAWEQAHVKRIQEALQRKGYAPNVPGWADGIFEAPTVEAVAAFQRREMPGTEFYGQVWADDWAVLVDGKPSPAPAPAPAPAPPAPAPVRNVPAFPLPWGHYFGLITGPAQSHGGFYTSERQWVRMIQEALQRKGYAPKTPGWADGLFEQPTADAVAAFQRREMPGTQFYGQVWGDDWAKLLA